MPRIALLLMGCIHTYFVRKNLKLLKSLLLLLSLIVLSAHPTLPVHAKLRMVTKPHNTYM